MTTVLDHGYVELVESWGSDVRIIEAARMSTDKGFEGWGPKGLMCPRTGCGWTGASETELVPSETYGRPVCPRCLIETDIRTVPGDEKLLKYLYKHNHATPFEMAGMTIVVQAPIFVFREWHRHRTQSYNEMSSRYTPLPDLNYIPTVERLMTNSKTNKQAGVVSGAMELSAAMAEEYRELLKAEYAQQERLYQIALQMGVPKELARVHLPVGRYSRMRASANLRNWLSFLTLRLDLSAQYEIRQFANAVGDLIAEQFPRTWVLFIEGRL